ncbi:copper resistance CopC/CopD family protein [Azospirillum sp. B506]|uniref:copper resistance CopC/CopD family protein n=1 Tax=Azospirillum sp. B506 TaxID=137721 RepID=UPI00034A0AEA|nr:copper resistance protein CopC [Azospirillum sp. B506]
MTYLHAAAAGPLGRGAVTVSGLTRAAWRFTRAALFLLAMVLSAAAGGEAAAHAFLTDTEPADSSRLESAPSEIRLTFNEPVTPILVQVLDAAGRPVAGEKPVAGPDGSVRLALPTPVPTGLYTVSYRVTSADGHPAAGTLLFGVGVTPPAEEEADRVQAGAAGPDAPALAAVAVRALHYGALLAATGGGLFLVLVSGRWSPLNRRLRPGLGLILLTAGLSAVLLVVLNGIVLNGSAPGTLLSSAAWAEGWVTGWTSSAGVSAAVALLALLAVAVGLALEADHGAGPVLLLSGAVIGAVSLALTGHAATAPPRWLSAPLVALHGLMAAFWIGALWPLAVALQTEPAGEAARLIRRFSRLALVAVALLVAVGALLSLLQIEQPAAVLATGYGWLWLGKMTAVGVLLALAACNRFWLTPALGVAGVGSAAALRRTIRAEAAVAAAVLVVTAAFALTPPPRTFTAPETPVGEAMADIGPAGDAGYATSIGRGDLVALIEVIPARPGPNRVTVHLSRPDGRPADPADANLEWSLPAAGLAPVRRSLTASAVGVFGAGDVDLPVAGRWSLLLEVRVGEAGPATFRTDVPVLPEDQSKEVKP